ncbi:nucleotidyltransferase domain-containing protein [Novosphingobium terrae]|uniref:nucleotidyltransferase domain-containing protein n=1 Tax=Novosphingobium terrae TaxID=2726189 RepID=UPI00197F942B|nr:nucleotidyltransferase domain-containing protein [Novosphingobium terrae]
MRTDLDHLPARQQDELAYVTDLLLTGFAKATTSKTQAWCRNGKVQKIVLFGSYARSDWVDEPQNGYQSDFDLLVIVSHPALTDPAGYWYDAEEEILRDPRVGRLVNIIVHTLAEVNQSIEKGEYFWTDIARDGILLHDRPGHPLAVPRPRTAKDAFSMASGYFTNWLGMVDNAMWLAKTSAARGDISARRDAAFLLHQATERAYSCYLLVTAFYVPRSHNIKFLRSLAEGREPRLIDVWPRVQRADRRLFELLKRAYVEARYSDEYQIDLSELAVLENWVRNLRDRVEALCLEQIDRLAINAGSADAGQ